MLTWPTMVHRERDSIRQGDCDHKGRISLNVRTLITVAVNPVVPAFLTNRGVGMGLSLRLVV